MTINYRKAYLTDGTQVKITEELFQQLKQWEKEGYDIPFQYTDILKQEDNKMINANRNFYIHNISLEEQLSKEQSNSAILQDSTCCIETSFESKETLVQINKILQLCTEQQRRRFIKYYYLGFTYSEIANQEGCYINAVRKSVKKVEKLLVSQKNMLQGV